MSEEALRFEKRSKNFFPLGCMKVSAPDHNGKSFLVLFFKKNCFLRLASLTQQARHQPRPSRLMRRAEPFSRLAMKIFVKHKFIAGAALTGPVAAEGAAAVGADAEQGGEAGAEEIGNFVKR
jgi:hypothetical protein